MKVTIKLEVDYEVDGNPSDDDLVFGILDLFQGSVVDHESYDESEGWQIRVNNFDGELMMAKS